MCVCVFVLVRTNHLHEQIGITLTKLRNIDLFIYIYIFICVPRTQGRNFQVTFGGVDPLTFHFVEQNFQALYGSNLGF